MRGGRTNLPLSSKINIDILYPYQRAAVDCRLSGDQNHPLCDEAPRGAAVRNRESYDDKTRQATKSSAKILLRTIKQALTYFIFSIKL